MNIHDATEVAYKNGYQQAIEDIFKDIDENADIVKVVRCRDCKHYKDEHSNCWLMRVKMIPNDYCSYGERREDLK